LPENNLGAQKNSGQSYNRCSPFGCPSVYPMPARNTARYRAS